MGVRTGVQILQINFQGLELELDSGFRTAFRFNSTVSDLGLCSGFRFRLWGLGVMSRSRVQICGSGLEFRFRWRFGVWILDTGVPVFGCVFLRRMSVVRQCLEVGFKVTEIEKLKRMLFRVRVKG